MYSVTNLIGGALWLNFLNTKRYSDGVMVDLLQNAELFKKWLNDNGLTEDFALKTDRQELEGVRELLAEIVEGYAKDRKKDVLEKLNVWISSMPLKLSFSAQNGHIETHIQAVEQQQELLSRIIHSFSETSKMYGLERVRQCDHDTCILFFLDISKGGRRRWCDMGTCGNRNKAAKHYQKKVKGT